MVSRLQGLPSPKKWAPGLGSHDRGQRGCGARVGRLVGHLLVAPVVHFQDGVRHRQTLHAGLELAVEGHAGRVQVLVVHADGQHEVAELPFRHLPAHLLADPERRPHLVQIVVGRIIRHVPERHVGIEELQRLFLGQGLRRRAVAGERHQRAVVRRHPGLEIGMHRFAVRLVLHEMRVLTPLAARQQPQRQHSPQGAAQRVILQMIHGQ